MENIKENTEYVIIRCNDKKIMQLLDEKYNDDTYNLTKEESNTINIVNIEGYTHLKLEEITKKVRDIIVTAEYQLEGEDYNRIYKYNYINGRHYLSNVEIQYNITYSPKHKELIEGTRNGLKKEIFDEMKDFYRKMDMVRQNELGEFIIDDNKDKEIMIKFEKEGLELTASKKGSDIALKKVVKLTEERQ